MHGFSRSGKGNLSGSGVQTAGYSGISWVLKVKFMVFLLEHSSHSRFFALVLFVSSQIGTGIALSPLR